jgi:hypothetical protein
MWPINFFKWSFSLLIINSLVQALEKQEIKPSEKRGTYSTILFSLIKAIKLIMSKYPVVKDVDLAGTYPALVKSGGGCVWDEVLEYRVWCHPEKGASDLYDGEVYYYPFATYDEALKFSNENSGTESPVALILQEEHINEPEPGNYAHVKGQRLTEWNVQWLERSKRQENTIPDFFSPTAPANRLDILRGDA